MLEDVMTGLKRHSIILTGSEPDYISLEGLQAGTLRGAGSSHFTQQLLDDQSQVIGLFMKLRSGEG
jgi:hypothetical protein